MDRHSTDMGVGLDFDNKYSATPGAHKLSDSQHTEMEQKDTSSDIGSIPIFS